jgi:predicted phage terminase large subunit-like protein
MSTSAAERSLASLLASLPARRKTKILAALTRQEVTALENCWEFWARPTQLAPPGAWRTWLILSGRGWGKTRAGAEWVRAQVESGRCERLALVGATSADTRDVLVEGESGILAISPPGRRPVYEPSKRRLTWPNGAMATLYSADEPDRLRGPQHDGAWADELAAWRYADAWTQLQFGLRLGTDPRVVVTTTPRPTAIVRELASATTTIVTRGTSYENRANLAPAFLDELRRRYEGTRIGRQEIFGDILDDNPGALFRREDIDRARVRQAPVLLRVVVAIDPAVSSNPNSDETGIVVAGLGRDMHAYVIDDVSGRYTPSAWARRAIRAFVDHQADRIVAEVNQGGALVEANLRTVDPRIPYKAVRASRGKAIRAEPIAALYEQGRVHHVGALGALEDQMCAWDPTLNEGSPDRVDALVWAVTELLLEAAPVRRNFENLPPA